MANLDTLSVALQIMLAIFSFVKISFATFSAVFALTIHTSWTRSRPGVRKAVYAVFILFTMTSYVRHDPRLNSISIAKLYQTKGHPIKNIIAAQRSYFYDLQVRQSRTLDAAIDEYKRRYKRSPPLGFGEWFELA